MFTIIGGDNQPYGPSTEEEIREWLAQGRADGRTLARKDEGEWKPLASFPEFAEVLAGRATPPPLSGAPGLPTDPGAVLASDPDFEIGDCLHQGGQLLARNFGLLVSASILVWTLDLVVSIIPLVGVFFSGVFYGGLYLIFLRRIRGQDTGLKDAFAGFGVSFVHLLLAGFLTLILSALATFCCCLLPGLYLKIAWTFALALVIDNRLEFWTAMELSRKVVTRIWLKVCGLVCIVFAPTILFKGFVFFKTWSLMDEKMGGLITTGTPDFVKIMSVAKEVIVATAGWNMTAQVVLLANLPFATAVLLYAYETLFKARRTPGA